MNIDTLVSELEKDHQKELDKVRKDLAFENWKDRQEHLEFVKSVWACMTIIDPWYVGLFDSCPDEKTILSRLNVLFKEDKKRRKIIQKIAKVFELEEEVREEEIPKIAKKVVDEKEIAEDKRQEAEDNKRELLQEHSDQLADLKRELEPTKTKAEIVMEKIDDLQENTQEKLEEVKSEQLEKEKKCSQEK